MMRCIRGATWVLGTLLCGVAWALPLPEPGDVLIAPPDPDERTDISIAVAYEAPGPDLDAGTGPVADIDGTDIRIVLQHECRAESCTNAAVHVRRVDIAALDHGDYTVKVYLDAQSPEPLTSFPLQVADGRHDPDPPPMQGFWSAPQAPGTGMVLQQRDDMLTIALLDFDAGSTRWSIGATPLRNGSMVAVLPAYADGSCLGCEPHVQPTADGPATMVRLRFESTRRAWLDLTDGRAVALTSLPFGARYVDVTLRDWVDADFGALPLPDLEGRWLLHADDLGGHNPLTAIIEFMGVDVLDGSDGARVRMSGWDSEGEVQFVMTCYDASLQTEAHCVAEAYPPDSEHQPGAAIPVWYASLGDIGEDRIDGWAVEPHRSRLRAIRWPD